MFTKRLSDGAAEVATEVEHGMADRAQGVRGVPRPNAAGVLSQSSVQNVEAAVLDPPAATGGLQKRLGVCLGARQAGDGVRHRLAGGLADLGLTLQANQLPSARPVEIAVIDEIGGRGQGSLFPAATALFRRAGGSQQFFGFTLSVGGKSFVESRRLAPRRA
jgi:hypothetical protein